VTNIPFFRLLKTPVDNKGDALAAQIVALDGGDDAKLTYVLNPTDFSLIPGSSFAYWVSGSVRRLFQSLPPLADNGISVQRGAFTADDFRFLRLFWEESPDTVGERLRWTPFAKGGEYSPFYSDVCLFNDN